MVATAGIFLPSFLFVGGLTRILPRLRTHAWSGDLLDGVNAAALGLMAGVLIQLAAAAITDPLTALLAIATGLALWRTGLNSAWLVLAGGLAGLAATASGIAH